VSRPRPPGARGRDLRRCRVDQGDWAFATMGFIGSPGQRAIRTAVGVPQARDTITHDVSNANVRKFMQLHTRGAPTGDARAQIHRACASRRALTLVSRAELGEGPGGFVRGARAAPRGPRAKRAMRERMIVITIDLVPHGHLKSTCSTDRSYRHCVSSDRGTVKKAREAHSAALGNGGNEAPLWR
jgi:hypothetical protein